MEGPASPPSPGPTPARLARLADLRVEYARAGLSESDVAVSPFAQVARWFDEALTADVPDANAFTLATMGEDGPDGRVVLLKGCDDRGLVFFTNYESAKGEQLANEPRVALVFFWKELERQVRVRGTAEKVAREESETYFRSRPPGSQLGAWASPQSRAIASRAELDARYEDVQKRFQGESVPLPPHWGGYRVVPTSFEFWQGRPSRLHDRLRYVRLSDGWRIERLAP